MTHHDTHADAEHEKVRALLQHIGTVMLVTHDPAGGLNSRPMQIVGIEGDTVWFFTDVNSPKSMEIGRDHDVLLAASHPEHKEYVSISGQARVVQDVEKQRALWTEDARPWFPDGAPSEDLALISVRMQGGEYWDSRPAGGFLAFSYIQEQHKDEAPAGDHEKVSFSG